MTTLRKALLAALFSCASQFSFAFTPPDEGMWLPMFIERLNYTDMKAKGLQLSAEEIYSINNSSLKDAIVMFGQGFCTGEVVSSQGLVFTNHHCAYDMIQANSTTTSNYLRDGFWAKNLKQELPNPGITVSFLVRMEDVSSKVLAVLNKNMREKERNDAVQAIAAKITQEAVAGTHYNATIKPFFDGNEYYMFVYETFRDVRLVGNPPESIGKFGGDTDNWMWPRHTGDFAVLRIYTGPDGKPADYSEANIPLKPRRHLSVSLKGVEKNDFTMIMGYPGSTNRFLTSYGVKQQVELNNPDFVAIRDKRLSTWKSFMDQNETVRLQYASKYAGVANYWKYFMGQTQAVKDQNIIALKQVEEERFRQWFNADPVRKAEYGETFNLLEAGYTALAPTVIPNVYYNEAARGIEIFALAQQFMALEKALSDGKTSADDLKKLTANLQAAAEEHFKDYNAATDQKIGEELLKMYAAHVDKAYQSSLFTTIQTKYKGSFAKYFAKVFATSIFASQQRTQAFLANPNLVVLQKDLAYQAITNIYGFYEQNILPKRMAANEQIAKGNRLFVKGVREMNANTSKKYYPNANSTMRLTYGQVLDYAPKDGTIYNYFTTHRGILQKEDPNNPEFIVHPNLKKLLSDKDFGRYGKDGQLNVAFITNNDITGGNSGSPVLNGKGELIGLAFDGNWEAMGDKLVFQPELQRCIVVDIRYVLFVIDKFAGASHLVNEMTLAE